MHSLSCCCKRLRVSGTEDRSTAGNIDEVNVDPEVGENDMKQGIRESCLLSREEESDDQRDNITAIPSDLECDLTRVFS